MAWVPVAVAASLLLALAYPFVVPRVTRGRRARRAHQGGLIHWYPNYDENLRFEPCHDDDIVAIARVELEALGYHPTGKPLRVPRTFRDRVAGDRRIRLWTCPDPALRPVWTCCWHGVELPTDPQPNVTLHLDASMLTHIDTGPRQPIDLDVTGDETSDTIRELDLDEESRAHACSESVTARNEQPLDTML